MVNKTKQYQGPILSQPGEGLAYLPAFPKSLRLQIALTTVQYLHL